MKRFNARKLFYGKIADTILRNLFRLFRLENSLPRPPINEISPRRILIIESHLIGDIVIAIPAMQALRKRFPSSMISFVAGPWAEDLLGGQGIVDEFIHLQFPWAVYDYSLGNLRRLLSALLKIRREPWDLGLDLRGDFRNIFFLFLTKAARRMSYGFTGGVYMLTDVVNVDPAVAHLVDYDLHLVKQLGCQPNGREPRIHVSESQLQLAGTILGVRANSGRCVIGIHPGASNPLRQWRPERFAALAERLASNQAFSVFFFAGPKDGETIRKICEAMSNPPAVIMQPLRLLPALFAMCGIVVGLDSGASHIAAAVGSSTITLFGPADPETSKPISVDAEIIIKEDYWCRPCEVVRCVQPENNCMDALEVNALHNAIVLAARRKGYQVAVP